MSDPWAIWDQAKETSGHPEVSKILNEQQRWAQWYTRARAAYVQECKKRGVNQIDWRELPLISKGSF